MASAEGINYGQNGGCFLTALIKPDFKLFAFY